MSNELHDQIMNIQYRRADDSFLNAASRLLYKEGHRDARHAAAELAIGYVTAPASPAAPSGELPPLPEALYLGGDEAYGDVVRGYVAEQMQAYGAACHALGRGAAVRDYIENGTAIAHQPPKEAMTDEQLGNLYQWTFESQPDCRRTAPKPAPLVIAYGRAVANAVAAESNKQLAEALKMFIFPYSEGCRLNERERIEAGRAALVDAGVEVAK